MHKLIILQIDILIIKYLYLNNRLSDNLALRQLRIIGLSESYADRILTTWWKRLPSEVYPE